MTRRRLPVSPAPEDMSDEDKLRLWTWHVKTWPSAYRLPNGKLDTNGLRRFLRDEIDDCLDWHRSSGVLRADWLATVRRWIRKTHDRDGFARREPKSSPLPRRAIDPYARKHREPVKVGDELAKVMPLFGEDKR
jgi:hypothetical protein